MKILINKCFGGFEFSDEFIEEYTKRTGTSFYYNSNYRTANNIIELFEELGSKRSSSKLSKLKLVEIPDDVEWEVQEYDGNEWIAEVHRTWT